MTARACAVVGGGVIGAGWAARFLLQGLDVAVYDPHPDVERTVEDVQANAGRAQARLTAVRHAPGRLRFAPSVAVAVEGADLVQESAPEREDLKQRLLAEIDAAAAPDALICSSTSGLLPTRLQAGLRHPGRFVVGHPFNPVYLLPLVEVCAGAVTDPASVERAMAFYAGIGMKPLHVRHEVDGFIADRLLEALWREALWLVHDGIATTAEVDDAIRFGAGLRWSFMGTFLTYRLAGGPAGMRHFLQQFGPALQLPWTRLTDVPELTDGLIGEIARQSDAQAAGVGLRELERKRDDCLVAVIQALKLQEFGAGAVLAAYEARHATAPGTDKPGAPLRTQEGAVPLDWLDYNRHMTESRYLGVFSAASDAVLDRIGAGADYVAGGHSFYTAETHIVHRREIAALQPYYATTQVLAADAKRMHLFHRLHHGTTHDLLATGEQMLLHVDMGAGRSAAMRPDVAARLHALRDAHAALPRPAEAGRSIGIPAPRPGVPSPDLSRMIDAEMAAFIARTEAFYPPEANAAPPAGNRAAYNRMCAAFRAPRPARVAVADQRLAEHGRTLVMRHYQCGPSRTVLLYLHGGGFVLGGLESHDDVCAELCDLTGGEVACLDYRLAPEHPYPAALDDAEAAFLRLGAGGRPVIVAGDSAGGNLAAALCLRRRCRGGAAPAGQALIYPGLGGNPYRNGVRNLHAPLLPARESAGYRGLYAGGEDRAPTDDPEFAPLCAADLAGLPPAAIFAAGIDPLCQDAEDYAALLAAAGNAVLFRREPGLVHGYLRARHMSRAAGRSFAAVAAALRQMEDGSFADEHGHGAAKLERCAAHPAP